MRKSIDVFPYCVYDGIVFKTGGIGLKENIRMENVTKSFGGKAVLRDVSLSAIQGEILCLLGPSGAGKTTLIRLVTGAIRADSGDIFVAGKKIPDRSAQQAIGFMPQNDAVYTDISGLDNLMFFGRLFHMTSQALKSRTEEVLRLVDLYPDRHKLAAHYSGGMKKRLSLAIALLNDPDILLLDEPTVGIDPVLRKAVWDRFESLRLNGKTIVISTHVMDEAIRCQRAALILGGSIIENDSTQNLVAKTESGSLEELFFMAQKEGA
jgi:ABC-2 type transport system ATP-binding protein